MSERRTFSTLGEILEPKQLCVVLKLLKASDTAGLRAYLQSTKEHLATKGIAPDYLYYYLVYSFRLGVQL